MTELALQLDSVCKTYKGFALRNVSFELPRGYIMGLIGANGAGKTTILKLILNLIRRDSGRITVFGKDNLQDEVEVKRNIGFVHDVPRFYDDAKLKDIGRAVAPFYPNWDRARFDTLVGEFGLPMRKKFKTLSTGMKTQFALSLALSHDAELILMDEPTSGLDPIVRRELLDKLRDILQDEQKAIVFSTHITSDLERIADYITCVHEGQILFCSPREEILEQWGVVRADEGVLSGDIQPLLRGVRHGAHGCEALTNDVEAARAMLPSDAVIETASLDDIVVLLQSEERSCSP
ncbi:MAG: ABC transporter ATP-binding protein [Pirellulaceae bacterium]|jgi:ABC-2 type transport system ATP-binding protein|nr:ABC transporter ATP-binding protein [Pirellulaceae bacterium]